MRKLPYKVFSKILAEKFFDDPHLLIRLSIRLAELNTTSASCLKKSLLAQKLQYKAVSFTYKVRSC